MVGYIVWRIMVGVVVVIKCGIVVRCKYVVYLLGLACLEAEGIFVVSIPLMLESIVDFSIFVDDLRMSFVVVGDDANIIWCMSGDQYRLRGNDLNEEE